MQVQVNTDKNVEGGERLTEYVKTAINAKLHRFGSQITRVEAHLSDENSQKSHSDGKKCVLEARPAGMQPVVVTHLAATLDQAISGAAEKLERVLDSTLGQLNNPKGSTAPDGV
ncbi:MAG: HPF/RaiA family ribosome-associated protein [Polaromonas sp.]|nr:HPF/RaiA family ribosome-associated protein [Polaromonas sp.]